jgi:RNA-splicing ligase RtcB
MPYVKKTIEVTYEDNSYGKQVTKTKSFSGKDQEEVLKEIAKWRYDNGYIIRSSLDPVNFTFSMGED